MPWSVIQVRPAHGQTVYLTVLVSDRQTLTIDIDAAASDTVVTLHAADDGALLAEADDASRMAGGLGSANQLDAFVSYTNTSGLAQQVIVRVGEVDDGDGGVFEAGEAFLLLASLTRHAVGGTVPEMPVVLRGGDGTDTLIGGNGDDRLWGGTGSDDLLGGPGADWLIGGPGADRLSGGAGDDFYMVDGSHDIVREFADEGHDRVAASSDFTLPDYVEDLRLFGQAAAGTGNALGNRIMAGAAPAALRGLAGDDTLIGSAYDDMLEGGEGADRLHGSGGADLLVGDAGNDVMDGGAQDDALWGDDGNDVLRGGDGRDSLTGGAGHDRLFGGGHSDILVGGEGDDTLRGGGAPDELYGGAGDDVLAGEAGRDILSGGGGADLFVFGPADLDGGADTILDFSSAEGDRIHLSAMGRFHFIADAGFSGTAGELRWAAAPDGISVLGDIDGDGMADFAIRLAGVTAVTATDFIL